MNPHPLLGEFRWYLSVAFPVDVDWGWGHHSGGLHGSDVRAAPKNSVRNRLEYEMSVPFRMDCKRRRGSYGSGSGRMGGRVCLRIRACPRLLSDMLRRLSWSESISCMLSLPRTGRAILGREPSWKGGVYLYHVESCGVSFSALVTLMVCRMDILSRAMTLSNFLSSSSLMYMS